MYKILLVDDEILVRDAIRENIDWKSLDCELVGDCENGRQAVEFVQSHKVDVVLTYICMPYMDGMELSEFLHDNYPDILIVIFSGFGEFEYAKKAIRYNVSEYMLKPVTAMELTKVLRNMKEKLDSRKKEQKKMESLSQTSKDYHKNVDVIRSKALETLVNCTRDVQVSLLELKKLGISFDWILRLGVAQLLSDLQSLVKAQILPHHLGEHEVGGAVDDAFHLGDDVGREALVHRGDDGRTAAHGSLEQEGAVVCLGQSQQLCAVGGHHLLVGGADAPTALETGLDVRVSEAGAADGLDDDLYFGVFQNGVKILYKQLCGLMIREVFGVKDVLDLYPFACTAGDACGVEAEPLVHAAAHRAKAQNRDFCHDTALVPFFYECTVTDCIRSVRPRPSAGAKAFPSAPRGSSAWCRCGW